ncbi:nitroreductase family protein [Alkalicella caledoniensis]|uniref:Nitroreductase family protein n=1 Tax=Alkalicella caledoniensis TaxID=2731377 RepID=A0A7G9WAS9_ALKCA|nr:nitroreductase family protein [Alkalicella caledoniensis]QNO15791.1 nitroreductase family protein [Alkalicella caledoniensis]
MTQQFLSDIEKRRSIYHLNREIKVSDQKIMEIVNHAVKHTPSAFNSQSARVVVLMGEQHEKLWNHTEDVLRGIVPAESFKTTQDKMESFRKAYGTVLFFEDQATVESLQKQFDLYKDNFPVWSQHSSGMLQFVVWTALANEGIGASLQHYNPLIDEKVIKEWNVPVTWKLIAQMPFGNIGTPAGEKEFSPLENRVKLYK